MRPYDQVLCTNGHYFEYPQTDWDNPIDYDVLHGNKYKIKWRCPHCKNRMGWWNPVDSKPVDLVQCSFTHPITFLIPSKGGRKIEY